MTRRHSRRARLRRYLRVPPCPLYTCPQLLDVMTFPCDTCPAWELESELALRSLARIGR